MDTWYVPLVILAGLIGVLQMALVLSMEIADWRDRRRRAARMRAAVAPLPPSVPLQPWPWWVPPDDRAEKRPLRPRPLGTPPRGIPLDGSYRRGRR